MADQENPVEAVPQEEGKLNTNEAMRDLLKRASYSDNLFKGLNEVARLIDRGEADVCFTAKNCDVKDYKELVKALCGEKNIPIIEVSTREALGELVGLFKLDASGDARKIVKTSSVAVRNADKESQAWKVLFNN